MINQEPLTKTRDPLANDWGEPPTQHPYQNFVKRIYADKLKYSHNSIYANPVYPVRASRRRDQGERVKFSIIGIRSIPEFNYCVQIAQGLHKSRAYLFAAPEIQAVTCVDWPKVWTDLKVRFGGITYCVQNSVVILINGKILGGKEEFEQYIRTRYNYYLCLDYYKLAVNSFIRFVRSSGRPHAYMHIAVDDEVVGTLIFRLFSDLLPSTCDNFLRLCNATRGGYGGTPIHRIVKDNWIQCGGYGLKNNPHLDCENFMVPFDRRGVLGMANDGRNCDCSTQFFVLLQPSPWMACKYVAFGQLIDGEQTLAKIEKVPTFYESPLSNIVLAKVGILNLEATDIVISPGTTEYIQGHIEDLIALGDVALGWLLERLDLEIEMIEVSKLMAQDEGQEDVVNEVIPAAIRNTERFMRKRSGAAKEVAEGELRGEQGYEGVNEDFDVEEYEYVYEEEVFYKQVTPPASVEARPARPYYLPLTDVPYPGETDSTYDLKKFLKGDYCLESDLGTNTSPRKGIRFHPDLHHEDVSSEESKKESLGNESVYSLDSDEESEIRRYIRNNCDHASFAGAVVSKIALGEKEYVNIFKSQRQAGDEKAARSRKVSMAVPDEECPQHKIKRRQTGYVKLSPSDMEGVTGTSMMKFAMGLDRESSDAQGRHVRIADSERHESLMGSLMTPKQRLSSAGTRAAFVRGGGAPIDERATEDSEQYLCVMKRLYEEVTISDETVVPTLKTYRPLTEPRPKGHMLTHSVQELNQDETNKSKFRASFTHDQVSIEHMLTLQYGKKFARKISSDYVKTIDQYEHLVPTSLRSLEYAKKRPAMSVAEYQARNALYEENKRRAQEEAAAAAVIEKSPRYSIKIETKMEPPVMYETATQSVYEEEERNYEGIEKLTSSYKKEEVTSSYEQTRIETTKVEETIVEEHKTVKTFMDPPQAFNTRSTTSTINMDEATTGGDDADVDVGDLESSSDEAA